MSRGSQPSFDYLSVAVSVPADATRPYAGIFADPPKAHKHLAKLTPKCPKARQAPGSARTLQPRPHRRGGIASPQAAHLERARRN